MAREAITGKDLVTSTEGFAPYFAVDPEAQYAPVTFELPGTSAVIAKHYGSISHILNEEAAHWVAQVGMGVGDPSRPQYAVYLSTEPPLQAQLFERLEP